MSEVKASQRLLYLRQTIGRMNCVFQATREDCLSVATRDDSCIFVASIDEDCASGEEDCLLETRICSVSVSGCGDEFRNGLEGLLNE